MGPDGAVIRQKIKQALLKANGRQFENDAAMERFIDAELEFPLRYSYGSNSSCVEIIGVDLCLCARVKHYCMFHHEPAYDDETLHHVLGETRRYAEIAGENYSLQVSTAYDGLVIDL